MYASQPREGTLYYGWIITVTLAITETISWGILYYAFTVFITPMEAELGWSRGELTGGFSLLLLIAGVMAFPVGTWIDKHGARLLMTIGSILASLLVVAWSQVDTLANFYLIFTALGVCAALILYEPAFVVVTAWFSRRRTTALAIITFAGGLASTIFVPLSDALLNAYGWRDSVLILGISLAVTTILPHALILRRRPSDLGLLPDGDSQQPDSPRAALNGFNLRDALRSRYFWWLTLAFTLVYLTAFTMRVHFIPLLIDVGINPSTAAVASGAIGFMQVAGRVVFAPLDSRLSSRVMAAGVFALQATAISIFLMGTSMALLVVFIVVFGTSFGALTLARPAVLAEMFGALHYGRISSIMAIFVTFAGTAAPVGAGLMYDHFGNYTLVLWLTFGFALGGTLVMILTKPHDSTL